MPNRVDSSRFPLLCPQTEADSAFLKSWFFQLQSMSKFQSPLWSHTTVYFTAALEIMCSCETQKFNIVTEIRNWTPVQYQCFFSLSLPWLVSCFHDSLTMPSKHMSIKSSLRLKFSDQHSVRICHFLHPCHTMCSSPQVYHITTRDSKSTKFPTALFPPIVLNF
jgi:hypothetical protein